MFPTSLRYFSLSYLLISDNIISNNLNIKPTLDDRGWTIPFFHEQNPWFLIILSPLPALLATILIFMDQQITAVIINRKEYKLKVYYG